MHVTICDVGPRDGLQNEAEILPPSTRAALIDRLSAAGLPRIERSWGGPIDVSSDHLPFFGTVPGARVHYGAG